MNLEVLKRAMKVSYNIELIPSYTSQIDKNIVQY